MGACTTVPVDTSTNTHSLQQSDSDDTSANTHPWIKLFSLNSYLNQQCLCFFTFTKPVKLNDNELLISVEYYSKHDANKTIESLMELKKVSEALFKYNIIHDQWEIYFKYPTKFAMDSRSPVIIEKHNKLYMNDRIHIPPYIYIFNTNTKNFVTVKKILHEETHPGGPYQCIMFNDEHHTIGSGEHVIWDDELLKYHTIFQFRENIKQHTIPIIGLIDHPLVDDPRAVDDRFWNHLLVPLPLKKSILLIGGQTWSAPRSSIYVFKHNKNWSKLNINLPIALYAFGGLATDNERFVIMFGGSTEGRKEIDSIFIMDLDTMSCRQSSFKCPNKGSYDAIKVYDNMYDEIIVFGYMRLMFDSSNIYTTVSLIKLILSFHNTEWIYLIHRSTGNLWKTKISSILDAPSVSNTNYCHTV